MTETIWLAIAALLAHASWRLATVATKLDLLCDKMRDHEIRTDEDIKRLHERVDGVETRMLLTNKKQGV